MRTLRLLIPVAAAALLAALGCEDTPPAPSGATSAKPTMASTSSAAPIASAAPLPPMPAAPPLPATPAPLPELKATPDNPMTAEKVNLGKQLFFDKRLSKDGSAS